METSPALLSPNGFTSCWVTWVLWRGAEGTSGAFFACALARIIGNETIAVFSHNRSLATCLSSGEDAKAASVLHALAAQGAKRLPVATRLVTRSNEC